MALSDSEKLEKIKEFANSVIVGWHLIDDTDVEHNNECYLYHPACVAHMVIGIADEGKYKYDQA